MLLEGRRAGTVHQVTDLQADGTAVTLITQSLTVSRMGQAFSAAVRERWRERDGFLELRMEIDLGGELQVIRAAAEAGGIRVEQKQGGRSVQRLTPASGKVLGAYESSRLLRQALARGEERVDYLAFSPDTLRVERVRVRFQGPGAVQDSAGGRHRGVMAEERLTGAPEVVSAMVLDEEGELLYSRSNAGLSVELVRSGPQDAGLAGAPRVEEPAGLLDIAALAIPVEGAARLPPSGRGRGRLRFSGEGVPALERLLRASEGETGDGRYELVRLGEELEVSLGSGTQPGAVASRAAGPGQEHLAPEEAARAAAGRYLGDGYYLGLKDPRLAGILAGCGGAGQAGPQALACLEEAVYSFIRSKNGQHGFAGVPEILDSRAGDCTEHAVLAAALLRRRGIPARLAYGFVLTPQGFVGHAWPEAWVGGRWVWLEPSLPASRRPGAKLRLGSIDPALPVWGQIDSALLLVAGGTRAVVEEWREDDG